MNVNYDARSAEEMLSVFEMIHAGRKVEREDVERVLDSQGYEFFFEYHLDPVWHEIDPLFSRELYVDMILSLQDHGEVNKGGMRLKEMLKRYRDGLNKVEMLRETLDKIRILDVEAGAKRAMTRLPEDTDVEPIIYLLIDGVNTGYAHYGKRCGVGLDLLGFAPINDKSAEWVESFLGHELHHIGFSYWSKKNLGRTYESMGSVHVDLALFAWCDMIMEGLATHYFGHFKEGELDKYASPDDLRHLDDFLYKTVNKDGDLEELKSEFIQQFLINLGYKRPCPLDHYLGAKIISICEENVGKERVMESIRHPGTFLPLYLECIPSNPKLARVKEVFDRSGVIQVSS